MANVTTLPRKRIKYNSKTDSILLETIFKPNTPRVLNCASEDYKEFLNGKRNRPRLQDLIATFIFQRDGESGYKKLIAPINKQVGNLKREVWQEDAQMYPQVTKLCMATKIVREDSLVGLQINLRGPQWEMDALLPITKQRDVDLTIIFKIEQNNTWKLSNCSLASIFASSESTQDIDLAVDIAAQRLLKSLREDLLDDD